MPQGFHVPAMTDVFARAPMGHPANSFALVSQENVVPQQHINSPPGPRDLSALVTGERNPPDSDNQTLRAVGQPPYRLQSRSLGVETHVHIPAPTRAEIRRLEVEARQGQLLEELSPEVR